MLQSKQNYDVICSLYLKGLAFIFFAAFLSLALQITGLIGENGILPITLYLEATNEALGQRAYISIPTLFWLEQSGRFLQIVCWLGVSLSFFVAFSRFTAVSLLALYIFYLSLYHAGQTFMTFQWDAMLLEVGFLSFLLVLSRGKERYIIVWLFRFLVFKFMLMSGIVKLFSGDKSWDSLLALNYHFETQPLPTPLAWHAHYLPESFLIAATALTLFIELILPFFIFTFRRIRISVAMIFIIFQIMIILTGNYNFFNLLTILICLFLFDDMFLKKNLELEGEIQGKTSPIFRKSFFSILVLIVVSLNIGTGLTSFGLQQPILLERITNFFRPFSIVNQYGPFAVMTQHRNEIIIEGSHDGHDWREYEFKHKPGELSQGGSWIIPHQPRLDWQMWFAALGNMKQNPWLLNTMLRLLQNKQEVVALLKSNPFSQMPPKFIRASLYRYNFIDPERRYTTGKYWHRVFLRTYYPAIKLTPSNNKS